LRAVHSIRTWSLRSARKALAVFGFDEYELALNAQVLRDPMIQLPKSIPRLTELLAPGAMGNMQTMPIGSRVTQFSYQGATPKLATVDGQSVVYDPAGNEIDSWSTGQPGVRLLRDYSARNRLAAATEVSVRHIPGSHLRFSALWTKLIIFSKLRESRGDDTIRIGCRLVRKSRWIAPTDRAR
jgi:hypothetical protein